MSIEKRSGRSRQRGISLIELIIFIIVISVGLLGILSVMNVTGRSSADPMVRKQAIAMAEAILEEVLSKDYVPTYAETDLVSCSNRLLYDGVDNYNCFSGTPATAVIHGNVTLGATPIPELAGYTATVVVTPVSLNGLANVKRITVSVNSGNETLQIIGYRSNL